MNVGRFLDSLALAGSPYQWAIAGVIAVTVFAPKLLPMLARLLGMEIKRSAGLPPEPGPARPMRLPEPEISVLPPERAAPPQPPPFGAPQPRTRHESTVRTWLIAAVVSAAAAVLLWYLLRTR